MKYYLSSYKFGIDFLRIKELLPQGAKIGHINNSRDWIGANIERKNIDLQEEITFLENLGFQCEHLDLKDYFGKTLNLKQKLNELDGVWICGGNTFVLRQAMRLSGFDELFKDLQQRKNFFWGGYSAGICILCDSLKYIDQVDDASNFPYKEIKEPIYEGLNVFHYALLPHYRSDHFESKLIEKEVERCIKNKWLFKVLKDGDVIILEQ